MVRKEEKPRNADVPYSRSASSLVSQSHSWKEVGGGIVPMEKHCKILFKQKEIKMPTSFIVLPYELDSNTLLASNHEDTLLAVVVGKCLLDINKATAQLSFWLMLKKYLTLNKVAYRKWMKRAKLDSLDSLSFDVVTHIGCGPEYVAICQEMLRGGRNNVTARKFKKNPFRAAKKTIIQSMDNLKRCFDEDKYFYLVDEFEGCPVLSSDEYESSKSSKMSPLRLDVDASSLEDIFMPFMNLTAMVATAVDGLPGLAKLLGLPRSFGIPASWEAAEAGLIHRKNKPSSVTELAVLQRILRRREKAKHRPFYCAPIRSNHSSGVGPGLESEMKLLKRFYEQLKPVEQFPALCRVPVGRGSSFWTKEESVKYLRSTSVRPEKVRSNDPGSNIQCVHTEPRESVKYLHSASTHNERKLHDPESNTERVHTEPSEPKVDVVLVTTQFHGVRKREEKGEELDTVTRQLRELMRQT